MRSTAVECPDCEEPYTPQGLYGHLRAHGYSGEELETTYREAIRNGRSVPSRRDDEVRSDVEGPGSRSEDETTGQDDTQGDASVGSRSVPGTPDGPAGAGEQEGQEGPTEKAGQGHPPGVDREPIARAADRLAFARQRRKAVEEAMETETTGGAFSPSRSEVPANDTWADLLEECEAKEQAARKELKRQVEHREVDRSV